MSVRGIIEGVGVIEVGMVMPGVCMRVRNVVHLYSCSWIG
jgi:hypothetical protein